LLVHAALCSQVSLINQRGAAVTRGDHASTLALAGALVANMGSGELKSRAAMDSISEVARFYTTRSKLIIMSIPGE
jgi:hypothetical protein